MRGWRLWQLSCSIACRQDRSERGEKMRRRYDDQTKSELAEQRLREREKGAEDYLDHLYATGQISPDEYARLLEM